MVNRTKIWTSGYTDVEPTGIGLAREERKRPDCDTVIAGRRFISDATCVNPLAASNVRKACSGSLAVAEQAEKEKHEKYGAMARQAGAQFFALALERTGGMGKQAALLIKTLLKVSNSRNVWAPSKAIFGLKVELSVIVQKWNAAIVTAGLRRSLRAGR